MLSAAVLLNTAQQGACFQFSVTGKLSQDGFPVSLAVGIVPSPPPSLTLMSTLRFFPSFSERQPEGKSLDGAMLFKSSLFSKSGGPPVTLQGCFREEAKGCVLAWLTSGETNIEVWCKSMALKLEHEGERPWQPTSDFLAH